MPNPKCDRCPAEGDRAVEIQWGPKVWPYWLCERCADQMDREPILKVK